MIGLLAFEGRFFKSLFSSAAKAGDQKQPSTYGLKPVPFKAPSFWKGSAVKTNGGSCAACRAQARSGFA
jgi:hypothetical protein